MKAKNNKHAKEEKWQSKSDWRYYQKNRESIITKSMEYYHKNKYSVYKARCKKKNMAFELTKEEFDWYTQQPCFYDGREPTQSEPNGVDRIINNKGYMKSNCVPCCKECNFAKGSFDIDTFMNICTRVYKYRKDKLYLRSRWIFFLSKWHLDSAQRL